MARHSSATAHEETPHVLVTSRTNTIINALKRRAQAVLNDGSIDPQSRAIIRYGLETNDPWLAELVKRVEARESIVNTIDFSLEPETFNQPHKETSPAKRSHKASGRMNRESYVGSRSS